ncbi:FemAB family PEP-CTERM system-associated protein [bacterium]|nr:FemAB family PEP-CTERM system-associated protein [bacterium]
MVEIIYCTEKDAARWDGFIDSREDGSFYHRFGWKAINEGCFGHRCHYLAAFRQGMIVGVLPLVYLRSRLFGKILSSLPFVNYGGVCCSDPEAERALLAEARQLVQDEGVGYLEMRSPKKLSEQVPTSTHKVSMTLALDPDPEVIWNAFKSKQRTEIRRVEKNEDLTVISGGDELLGEFYATLAAGWRSLGTPIYRRDYFAEILTAFPDRTRIFVARFQGRPVAAAFNGYDCGIVEGMWLGIDPRYRRLNANTLLYWEMIRDGCRRGMRVFHFGRSSSDSGGEFFKKKWNAVPRQLYYQYVLGTARTMPQLNVDNPKFRLAIAAWRKLPLGLTTSLGPHIARSIP